MQENKHYADYIERMARVRLLSSPVLLDLDDAEGYAERLRLSFQTIGQLAEFNRSMLDEQLYPLLETTGPLNDEQVAALVELSDGLLNVGGVEEYENLDLPVASLISSRLMESAQARNDLERRIRQLDTELVTCYSLMNMTGRIVAHPEICESFRSKGMAASQFFLDMLDKDRFLTIEDEELRGIVLTNARFSTAFFEHVHNNPESNARQLATLKHMWEIAQDPFYHEAVPDFDWDYFRFRVLEYRLHCSELLNACGFDANQLNYIADAADEMEHLFETNPDYFDSLIGHVAVPMICARSRYLTGRISRHEYRDLLLMTYKDRDCNDFGSDGCDANIVIPLELMCLLDEEELTDADVALLEGLYRDLSAYIFRMPNVGTLSFILEYYAEVLERFRELPGGLTFEDFVLHLLVALHPPTYVHSRMVAQITACLTGHLVDLMPEHTVGLLGCEHVEDVRAHRDELIEFAYHAALCHDFGKISIIDTIFMYGRSLLDFEFAIIQTHPDTGSYLLRKHKSTRPYADIARGHHRWHDDSRGYPKDFVTAESPLKVLIDLIACADCMDAATDSIGRTYKHGKSLDDYLAELREGAGTRYASWVVELVENPVVYQDLVRLLSEGRRQTYRDTYTLLREMTSKA